MIERRFGQEDFSRKAQKFVRCEIVSRSRAYYSPVMNVTLLKRSSTTCTTVPLALGYFLVSVLNALAGITASVVSTVALAMVP